MLTVTMRECRLPVGFAGACRDIDDFAKGMKIGEGSYGVVYRVQDITDESSSPEHYAVKRVRMENKCDGFPIPSLREVSLLRQLSHRNVVRFEEVVAGLDALEKTYMLMEFCDRDLASVLENMPYLLSTLEVRCIMKQILEGVRYLHANFVIHRDLKLANILLTNKGVIKIADFGLARKFSAPVNPMTPNVVTLWYRAPELLFGGDLYTAAVDNWSIGCMFAELVQKKPLLPGQSVLHQVNLICGLIGMPSEKCWPGWSKLTNLDNICNFSKESQSRSKLREQFSTLDAEGFRVLEGFLTYDPERRLTSAKALESDFFRKLSGCERIVTANTHIARLIEESDDQDKGLRDVARKQRKLRC